MSPLSEIFAIQTIVYTFYSVLYQCHVKVSAQRKHYWKGILIKKKSYEKVFEVEIKIIYFFSSAFYNTHK